MLVRAKIKVAYGVLIRITASERTRGSVDCVDKRRQVVSQVFTVLGLTSLSILIRVLMEGMGPEAQAATAERCGAWRRQAFGS